MPNWLLPPLMNNHGNYIVSLGNVCRWLAQQAEALGVEIYPAFRQRSSSTTSSGAVRGVATGDMGVARDGTHKPELPARHGAARQVHAVRGGLPRLAVAGADGAKFNLRDGVDPQKYGIGIKELWQVAPDEASAAGSSCTRRAGRSTTQHRRRLVHVSPRRQPGRRSDSSCISTTRTRTCRRYDEFQRFKTHPAIRAHVRRRQAARLRRARDQRGRPAVGPEARLSRRRADRLCGRASSTCRGSRAAHNAMKTGMLGRRSRRSRRSARGRARDELADYPEALRASRGSYEDLYKVRNVKPGLRVGHVARHAARRPAHVAQRPGPRRARAVDAAPRQGGPRDAAAARRRCRKIEYPEVRRRADVRQASSVFVSNTNHEEDQPIAPATARSRRSRSRRQSRALRRARSSAIVRPACTNSSPTRLQRRRPGSACRSTRQNCVHCKTCDIKDPRQNIHWVTPEGGGGPNYAGM